MRKVPFVIESDKKSLFHGFPGSVVDGQEDTHSTQNDQNQCRIDTPADKLVQVEGDINEQFDNRHQQSE